LSDIAVRAQNVQAVQIVRTGFFTTKKRSSRRVWGNEVFLVMAVEIHPPTVIFSFSAGDRKVMNHSFENT
jgi:hypothetical protein